MRRTFAVTAFLLVLAAAPASEAAVRHVIRGAGFGHGIGMSQYGAYGYALEGARYQGILAHYYKGTRLSTARRRRHSDHYLAREARGPLRLGDQLQELRPDAAARPGPELRLQRALPRLDRGAGRRRRGHIHQRARHGQLPPRRGGGRDAERMAARGAEGAGGGGTDLRARHPEDDRRL